METCLGVFIVAKRHHDHSNSYKGKHFTEAGLQVQRFNTLLSLRESWQRGEVAQSSVSGSAGSRKRE